MTIKSVAIANITDLITCAVTSIYNFFKDCEASNGSKKERKERWNKRESNGCWGRS